MDLSDIRQQIDQIDQDLLALIAKRHHLAYQIAEIKKIGNLPLKDIEREHILIQNLITISKKNNYLLDAQYITQLYQRIIEDSLTTQKNYLENKKTSK